MDVTGVFGYSDEDGTEAASYDAKLDEDEVRARAEHVTALVEELNAQRAEERIGEVVEVLVESLDGDEAPRAAPPTRGPRSTARTTLERCRPAPASATWCAPRSSPADGVDLVRPSHGEPQPMTRRASRGVSN